MLRHIRTVAEISGTAGAALYALGWVFATRYCRHFDLAAEDLGLGFWVSCNSSFSDRHCSGSHHSHTHPSFW